VAENDTSPTETIEKLLAGMTQHGASDMHIKVGYPPYYRLAKTLRKLDMAAPPTAEFVEQMFLPMISEARREEYERNGSLDFSIHGRSGDRYRINIYRSTGNMNASVRRVQNKIPSFEELNLPPIYNDTILKTHDGLVLVSGVTGSGKSSTLAALVQHINEQRSCHIITIEDPIEYVFEPVKSIVSQREIGLDVPNFGEALRSVVRQDPDVILIGELRDKETMSAALQAAETGHLVLGSLHVSDAQQTFSRILEFFPRNEHSFVRSSLANSLRAIMCQRLVPGAAEGSQFPATEVLIKNATVRDKITNEEDGDIPAIIAQSEQEGMRSFTSSLVELIEADKVHYDTAMEFAPNREGLASAVKGIKSSGQSIIGRR
jgi:twitching motility protein PilT